MPDPSTDALLLDEMLGKLVTYLRMCGYDADYALDDGVEDDDEILDNLQGTDRTLLTRDRELADRASSAVLLQSKDVTEQLQELRDGGYELELTEEPSRCGVCNSPVTAVGPDEATPEYAPDTTETPVWRCQDCGQHFWNGSHWDDMAETIASLS